MNMRKLSAILFDLDGVIVDTARYHYLAWERLADSLDIYFDEKINERLKGVSREKSLEIVLENSKKEYSSSQKSKLCNQKNEWYVQMINNLTPSDILPGVMDVLDELQEYNIKISICSASKNATNIIKKLQIGGYFDVIVDGNNVSRPKPDPEVFVQGYKKLGVMPEECIVVEDAFAGIEAAQAVGLKTVGIGSKGNLYNADLLYKDMTYFDLSEIANKLNFILGGN